MRITNYMIKLAQVDTAEYLVAELSKKENISFERSFNIVINTKTYELLMNSKSNMYAQSPQYVWKKLNDEFNGDWEEWKKL